MYDASLPAPLHLHWLVITLWLPLHKLWQHVTCQAKYIFHTVFPMVFIKLQNIQHVKEKVPNWGP